VVQAAEAIETRDDWESEAACRAKPALFGTDVMHETPAERYAREDDAKRVCASCAVTDACLAYALRVGEPLGIWGGLTEAERRALTAG
jgi:WhiB family transcriptional regulator, redox-sensing transcriptional regulator